MYFAKLLGVHVFCEALRSSCKQEPVTRECSLARSCSNSLSPGDVLLFVHHIDLSDRLLVVSGAHARVISESQTPLSAGISVPVLIERPEVLESGGSVWRVLKLLQLFYIFLHSCGRAPLTLF